MAWNNHNRLNRLPNDWNLIRQRILKRDRFTCAIQSASCAHTATEVDHITPNDDHRDTNLRAVCSPCHAAKSSREGVNQRQALAKARKRPRDLHPGSR